MTFVYLKCPAIAGHITRSQPAQSRKYPRIAGNALPRLIAYRVRLATRVSCVATHFRSPTPAAHSQVSPLFSFQIAWDSNRLYNT